MSRATPIGLAILSRGRRIEDLQAAIDAATLIDAHQVRSGYVPRLYDSGVIYRRERHHTLPGLERIQSAEEAYILGYGDCDDLAPWRAAELQVRDGVDARAVVIPSAGIGYHVVVHMPDGTVEDPSARLGMLRAEEPSLGDQRPDVKARRRRGFRKALDTMLEIAKTTPHVATAKAALREARSLARAIDDENGATPTSAQTSREEQGE